MKKRVYLKYILFICLLSAFGFIFKESLKVQWRSLVVDIFQCKDPILYSIGVLDARFGISQENLLKAVEEAEKVWEKPINKELFSHAPGGDLKINLVYDYRQNSTQILQKLGLEVDNGKASYEELKRNYELMTAHFEQSKSAYESRVAAFEARKNAYETDAARANRKKNISKEEYDRLSAEESYLKSEVASLNEMRAGLQEEVENINALGGALNNLARELNLDVANYNKIGDSFGGEFTQGLYESHGEGEGITVFQYDSYEKLVRVLAHELGHALSLEHLDNPKAIMYRLNQGDNDTLTADDLSALKTRCGIK